MEGLHLAPLGKGLLDVLTNWSGAFMCPASQEESTVRYLSIEVDDALASAEQVGDAAVVFAPVVRTWDR